MRMSVASGAGAYVQPAGTGERSRLRATSVIREVVLALVRAGLLLAELHEDVVDEARRTEAIEVRREPVRAERLVYLHEVLDRVLRGSDSAGRLHSDLASGLLVHVANRFEHHELHGERCRTGQFP